MEVESVGLVSNRLSSCPHRYDPRHNRWFQIQSLQQEHADLCVCVVGKYIYAVAGRDYHNDLNTVERYDPATNSWDYVAPLKREVRKPSNRSLPGFLPWAVLRCQGWYWCLARESGLVTGGYACLRILWSVLVRLPLTLSRYVCIDRSFPVCSC